MTTTSTLTDRYVWAVLRAIPEDKRADIEAELRATIADAIDARLAAGATPEEAEREALRELGDPALLASNYAGRPLHLIGPALFLDYWRLLRLLLIIVPACAAGGLIIAHAIDGKSIGEIIGSTVVTTMMVVVHLCFWVTLVFVVLERVGVDRKDMFGGRWDPETLPIVPIATRIGWAEATWSVIFLLLTAGAIAWQQYFSVFDDANGRPIPVLDPALWAFWLPYLFVLLGIGIVWNLVLLRFGRWTYPLAALNGLLALAFAIPAIWLQTTGQLVNPEYFAAFDWEAPVRPDGFVTPLFVLGVAAIAIGTIADSVLKARRASQA